jgi:hypothetical protein
MDLLQVTARNPFRLYLRYSDGSEGEVDLSEFVGRGVFSAWKTPGVFEQVQLAEAGHPEWPGGLDLCPDMLYLRLTGKSVDERFPALRQAPAHA